MTDEQARAEEYSRHVWKNLQPFLELMFDMQREDVIAPLCHCLVIALCHGSETIPDANAELETIVSQLKMLIRWNFAYIRNQKPEDKAFPYFITNPSYASPETLAEVERKSRELTPDDDPVDIVKLRPC
jgi:hypothetical protein